MYDKINLSQIKTEPKLIAQSLFLSDEGPMLETLDHTIRIGSTPTFLYFDLYLYSAYTAHYVQVKLNLTQSTCSSKSN